MLSMVYIPHEIFVFLYLLLAELKIAFFKYPERTNELEKVDPATAVRYLKHTL